VTVMAIKPFTRDKSELKGEFLVYESLLILHDTTKDLKKKPLKYLEYRDVKFATARFFLHGVNDELKKSIDDFSRDIIRPAIVKFGSTLRKDLVEWSWKNSEHPLLLITPAIEFIRFRNFRGNLRASDEDLGLSLDAAYEKTDKAWSLSLEVNYNTVPIDSEEILNPCPFCGRF
jgi:hypothetical protein